MPLRPQHVAPVTVAAVAARVGGTVAGDATTTVTGITHDSRDVRPGDLYVARAGAVTHGAAFGAGVVAAGATAVLTDASGLTHLRNIGVPVVVVDDAAAAAGPAASIVYGDPVAALRTFGVTGTNGKTTTTFLIEGGLRAAGCSTALVGTIETRIAGERMPSVRTTPEATDLHALFAVMRERGVDAVAMEVSSHALALGRVDGVVFDVAGFTNLTQDHLDFHADLEDYFAAKAQLFTPSHAARGVANAADAHGARLAASAPVPMRTFSMSGPADWRATLVVATGAGSEFTVRAPDGNEVLAYVQLPGAFNVGNAVLAIAMLAESGIPLQTAAAGVASLAGVPGRMERIDVGQDFLAVVDYAHTPAAVDNLLSALRPMTAGRIIGVLGCGGDRDRGKRPMMASALTGAADVAVLTSDNPRSEDPAAILADMRAGAQGEASLHVEPDRRAAIALAVSLARPGDTVVVAGKGHEQGQDIGGVVTPFDDRDELAAAIRAAE